MDVIEAVRDLGMAIQQDERYVAYQIAKQANDEDEELQNAIGEFNLLRMSLNNELQKEAKDDDKLQSLNAQAQAAYGKIMANEHMRVYNAVKNNLDALMNRVNSIISLSLDGEDPETCQPAEGCSGGCSSCAGCG
ncbi:MAG TPA: YlbF family regulator [Ruminococcaceae bacterium]|nr:YlbF family regulator [Oscillospiraceae bacterium]